MQFFPVMITIVPEVEALQVLLPPNPSLLEDWEKEMFPQREEMELHPVDRSGGSQVLVNLIRE